MLLRLMDADWAGGPGQSKADVQWLDQKLSQFFLEHELGNVSVS